MNERLRTELEFLAHCYVRIRTATLRLLRQMSDEELRWAPAPGAMCAGALLAQVAAAEDLRVLRRLVGKSPINEPKALRAGTRSGSRQPPPSKAELERVLRRLKAATTGFVRGLVFGRRKTLAPDVLSQILRLVLFESQCTGQVQLLRTLYLGRPHTKAAEASQ